MLRCAIEELEPGMVLGKSLFDQQGKLLLAAGYRLDSDYITRIRRRGFQSVLIFKEGTDEIIPEDIISEELRIAANQSVQKGLSEISQRAQEFLPKSAINYSKALRDSTQFDNTLNFKELTPQIKDIVEEVLAQDVSKKLAGTLRSTGSYQYEHAVEVMLISLKVALVYNYDWNELRQLGTAALLHDIGYGIIPEIVNKPENQRRLDEKMLCREHPVFGSILVDKSSEGLYIEQTSILQHHEKQDGSGYPLKKHGANEPPLPHKKGPNDLIFRHAEIISAANVYDALVSARPGVSPKTPVEALAEVRKRRQIELNQYVVDALETIIDPYPPGCLVKIEDCSEAKFLGFVGAVKSYRKEPERLEIVLIIDPEGDEIEPEFEVFLADPKLKILMVL